MTEESDVVHSLDVSWQLGFDMADPLQRLALRQVRADRELIEQLRDIRVELGISLDEIATSIGLSEEDLALIECNITDPTLSVLRRYSLALGVCVGHTTERPTVRESHPKSVAHTA